MSNFIVARRLLSSEDEDDAVTITLEPVCLVQDAPEDISIREVKDVLEGSGEASDFYKSRGEKWDWRNFSVVPDRLWSERVWTEDPEKWAADSYEEALQDTTYNVMGCDVFSYDSLADRIYGEVRVSLRLPQGLHSKLKEAADGLPFNSYCLSVLAEEVGETELLAKYEAERRKPGRPKKLEIVE